MGARLLPNNALLDAGFRAKVADFGVSNDMAKNEDDVLQRV